MTVKSAQKAPGRGRPAVICVTPVRNEGWTLERHLRCAELWADHVILADQNSHDDTRAIAARFSKTILVPNHGKGHDDEERHRLVLEAARTIPGPRVILAVDADEVLSADVLQAPEWERAIRSPPGTVLTVEWINYLPGGQHAWVPKTALPIGFVDDGRDHSPGWIHVERVLVQREDLRISLNPVKLLHFQYLDWRRMKSKQRRYQCAESLHDSSKRPIQLYRQYHRMDAVPKSEVRPADPAWLSEYELAGIDMTSLRPQSAYWTDAEVLSQLLEYGPHRFRRLNIWDVNWEEIARHLGDDLPATLRDPRTRVDKLIHSWLAATQRRGPDRWRVRMLQRMLIPFGW